MENKEICKGIWMKYEDWKAEKDFMDNHPLSPTKIPILKLLPSITLKKNMITKIFVICPVRLASEETRKKLEKYVSELEKNGVTVHLPHRDTNQIATGLEICTENMNAIKNADEVHIFYNAESQGIHFDMGVAFALNKKIHCVELPEGDAEAYINKPGKKEFPRMLAEWEYRK